MKKVLASILLVLYLAASSGIVINLHYCMNRVDSVKLGASNNELCGKCGMPTDEANGCCHDEIKIIKLQDDQKVSQLNFEFISFAKIAEKHSFDFSEVIKSSSAFSSLNNHSPPINKQDTYLVNCVFRI